MGGGIHPGVAGTRAVDTAAGDRVVSGVMTFVGWILAWAGLVTAPVGGRAPLPVVALPTQAACAERGLKSQALGVPRLAQMGRPAEGPEGPRCVCAPRV